MSQVRMYTFRRLHSHCFGILSKTYEEKLTNYFWCYSQHYAQGSVMLDESLLDASCVINGIHYLLNECVAG